MKALLVAAILLPLSGVCAFAGGPPAVAFAQAPEQSTAMCFGADVESAAACARRRCAEPPGVSPADCRISRACNPADWSADLFLQHIEGVHWHEFLCGYGDRKALMRAVALQCDGTARPFIRLCEIVGAWNRAGDKVALVYTFER